MECKDCYHCNSSNCCALHALQGMDRCKPKPKIETTGEYSG